ncbi:MAG: UTP--glucose-1-phosphate uridylyltransferase [Betaproteobacteria bacterium RIFCSPLOWO2_02_67_12]|nr:MAG: UTP--glucose-1-phosphate uridylyltransferase [Betaproteobacteria bacterium RIFCSPLOWO2_02_67_12]HLE65700.1 UTP--glucose-1-phosphate uridylyltransferase GalU [Burkholderiales bacterium]
MTRKLKKAVFPVAGLGSRFLPATKASPKEMLPIVDKPLIQYAVEEAAAAGITDMIFVTGRNKRAIEDHFDSVHELETELAAKGKHDLLELVQGVLPAGCRCIYIRQSEPLGLGHAVLCAQPIVGDEPFAVLLADDLIDAEPPVMRRMADLFSTHGCALLGVEEVPRAQTASYGIVRLSEAGQEVTPIAGIVEKPEPAVAPSTLAVVGRYVLTPAIFGLLARARPGRGGEIQLTDAIAELLVRERVLAVRLHGRRFDCGSKLGYLMATVELGLQHPEVGADFARYLKERGL